MHAGRAVLVSDTPPFPFQLIQRLGETIDCLAEDKVLSAHALAVRTGHNFP